MVIWLYNNGNITADQKAALLNTIKTCNGFCPDPNPETNKNGCGCS
ncbi:MAG: hypothetical protein Nk1A_8980 [Endomicrobiia bacterium]|nr:MAG: hypothetical protein Nk1A_8980 [Endomicrobiia bacterium]